MDYIINELQVVDIANTLNLSEVGICPSGLGGLWTIESTTLNVTASISGRVLEYTPTGAGSFSIRVKMTCDTPATFFDIRGNASFFNLSIGDLSEIYNFPVCCNDCYNPIIVSSLYEGDTYIPFSLDMEDGTVVKTASDDIGRVLDGKGLIELSEPLVSGANIQLQVDSETCKAVSSVVKVKAVSEDCDSCANLNSCHIRLLNVSVKSDGVNLVSISKLNLEAFGELRYRLDNGEWFSDWSSIGSFSSLVNHTLGIKLVNNPACRIEYPFLAISYT